MNESFDFKDAALPNIVASLGTSNTSSNRGLSALGVDKFSGAFTFKYAPIGLDYSRGVYNVIQELNFNASRCSNIYKDDCTTVQPSSYCLMYIIKIKK